MKKIFSLVLATLAATTMIFAAVQQDQATVNCGGSKTIVATPATGYHFVRWEKDGNPIEGAATLLIEEISADAVYEAIFEINTYTIRFLNGAVVLQSSPVEHGQMPEYEGATPTQTSTAQYDYTFAGWSPTVAVATQDQDYVAQFTPVLRSYTITFKNGDDVLQSGLVAYGETPVYEGATPTKEATAQYTYTFAGWDAEVVAVTGEVTYNATFTPNLRSYTITFKNGDDVLQSGLVAYGETPVYEGATPTKASDADYNYVWDGWTPEIASVTGEAVYVAHFTAVAKDEFVISAVVDPVGKGTVTGTGTVKEGATVTLTAESDDACYVFEKWVLNDVTVGTNATLTINSVSASATYTAVFKQVQHTITIKSGDSTKGTVSFQ